MLANILLSMYDFVNYLKHFIKLNTSTKFKQHCSFYYYAHKTFTNLYDIQKPNKTN